MKAGNAKQAVVLGIVAVLAIAFLGSRLLGGGEIPTQAQAVEKSTTAEPAIALAALPASVYGNAFSHSKLAPKEPESEAQPTKPFSISGLDGLPEMSGSIEVTPESSTAEPGEPEENAGNDRRIEQAPSHLELSAILRVEQPVAFISINGGESAAYTSGQVIARGIRLVAIGSSGVTVRIGGHLHPMRTGQKISLTTGAPL